MAQSKQRRTPQSEQTREGITRITVAGFKSINEEHSIEIRPLTILAGANSSGKSSIMQPLLLLKQTLEAVYDPGALLLNGPNVKFTSVDQLLSRTNRGKAVNTFHVGVSVGYNTTVTGYFAKEKDQGFDVRETVYDIAKGKYRLYKKMPLDEMRSIIPAFFISNHENVEERPNSIDENLESFIFSFLNSLDSNESEYSLIRNRCFLTLTAQLRSNLLKNTSAVRFMDAESIVGEYISQIVHLPGLRGSPERTYPVTAIGSDFPGTFENYVASVIRQWQTEDNDKKLEAVNRDLARLGLTSRVIAKAIDDTQVEIRVSRQFRGNQSHAEDMVSVADVGLGISQTLPVVVALHVADEGQLIYLEQPEIHLHPRAQVAMAEVLADAAKQGKRLVVETHSSLLLRGIQTLVAEGKLPPELVKLHWFTLGVDGSTEITSADLDETGAFGDWPEDFDTVTLDAESRYLDAAQARLEGK